MEREDPVGGNGAWRAGRWGAGWHSESWASARGLWKRPTPEQEAEDDRSWCEAACESGGLPRVLWCEMCQLLGDLIPLGLRRRWNRRRRGSADVRGPSRALPETRIPPVASEQAEG